MGMIGSLRYAITWSSATRDAAVEAVGTLSSGASVKRAERSGGRSLNFGKRAASEWAFLRGIVRILRRTTPIAKNPTHTLGDLAEELAARYGDRIAIESDEGSVSYRQWNRRADRYARWALGQGFGRGDVVALLMPNRAEYLSIWVGIAKAGAATALVNTNLTGAALAHSVNIVGARLIVVDAALLTQFDTARPMLDGAVEVVAFGDAGDLPRLDLLIEETPDEPLSAAERPSLSIEDKCLFVYTSGTTGLPKAVNLNQIRGQPSPSHGKSPPPRISGCLAVVPSRLETLRSP